MKPNKPTQETPKCLAMLDDTMDCCAPDCPCALPQPTVGEQHSEECQCKKCWDEAKQAVKQRRLDDFKKRFPKADPVGEQRVSDEVVAKYSNMTTPMYEDIARIASELLRYRSQSAAAAEEWTDKHLFQRVRVDHPCFHGEGELRQIEHARGARLGVLLEHGHIRWYEAETVRLDAPAAAVEEEKP